MKTAGMESISIPSNLSLNHVKKALQIGHDYKFFLLVESPRKIEVGLSEKSALPQLVIIGKSLILKSAASDLFRRMIDALRELDAGGKTRD